MNAALRPTRDEMFVTLGGRTVFIRQAAPGDIPALRAFFAALSDQSRRLRFFATTRRIDEKMLVGMVRRPGSQGTCVLACNQGDGRIVGAAQYAPDGPGMAEVAVAVCDAMHGEGIGTELIHRAAAHAVAEGFTHFSAMVMAENGEMLHVFRDCGLPMSCRMNGPIDSVVLELTTVATEPAAPSPTRVMFVPPLGGTLPRAC